LSACSVNLDEVTFFDCLANVDWKPIDRRILIRAACTPYNLHVDSSYFACFLLRYSSMFPAGSLLINRRASAADIPILSASLSTSGGNGFSAVLGVGASVRTVLDCFLRFSDSLICASRRICS